MKNDPYATLEFWFLTGSQHLYGEETLKQVRQNAETLVQGLNASGNLPAKLVIKPVLTNPESIRKLCLEANASDACAGLLTWCHTFSPSKMWISGLQVLRKPVLHLHTQFNRDLPWGEIDMDFMNLNQSAHGDREHGFIHSRLRLNRKVVVGYWEAEDVQADIDQWMRAAAGWQDWHGGKFCRFGDNMRNVAVTEGDKVAAEARFGFSVNGYGVGDLVEVCQSVEDSAIDDLCEEYADLYRLADSLKAGGEAHGSLREGARIELGIRRFLEAGSFLGFTTTFEDLHGLEQLPGLAVQRLMADGYGFGAEGDWKTCALLRAMKVMGEGRPGGTSFMEDYTYHLHPDGSQVLGAHMLEICPSITEEQPSLEIHPLGIGGKADPVRLVFNAHAGPALNASLIDLGNRFRMVVNTVDVVDPPEALPNLPVARAVWEAQPDFRTAATCWIHAGGAHHTGFSYAVNAALLDDFCDMAGIEYLLIDETATVPAFRKELRWNEIAYQTSLGY